MKHSFGFTSALIAALVIGGWATASSTFAQSAGTNAPATSRRGTNDPVARIRDEGLNRSQVMTLMSFLTDVHGLGLEKAQGLIFTETFYWDLNDQTRAWTKRFVAQSKGKYPTMVQAGVYSSVMHYLKAVEASKTDDGTKVIAQMKAMPTDDTLFGKGTIRKDGRKLHPAYLVEVKKPSESKGPYDYYKVRATIPADQAFRPEKDGGCNL